MSRLRDRRRFARSSALLGLFATIVLAAAACSGSASLPASGGGTGGRTGGGTNAGPAGGAPSAAPMAAPTAAPTAAPYPGNGQAAAPDAEVPPADALIVRTGSLALEVTNIDTSLLTARARIVGLGGYVSDSERTNTGDDDAMALISYRIPSARWDEALDALRGVAAKVVSENTKAVEVTGQVVDLQARITNLKSTEQALQTIMGRAGKISDVLEVQNQLTSVQGQIEQLTAQQNHLSDQAALATLAVTYTLPAQAPVTRVAQGFDPADEVNRAVAQLVQFGQGLLTIGIWLLIVGLPILLAFLFVAGLAVFVARRLGIGRTEGAPSERPA